MLNELETVYWAIVSDAINVATVDLGMFLENLMMTALYSKKLTCNQDDIKIYEAFLTHNYPLFMGNYHFWEESKAINQVIFNLVDVNEQFKFLFSEGRSIS